MSIWFRTPHLEELETWKKDTMHDHLDITLTEIGDDYLKGQMPITNKTVQPFRTMHGGASAALAETLGSIAAQLIVDSSQKYCVGLALNINHIRPIPLGGTAYGTARPHHLGQTTQVWSILIEDGRGKLASAATLTMAVLDRP